MAITLAVGQKLDLTLKLTPDGAAVDGKPAWSSADATIGTLTAADDGMSAIFEALKEGAVTLTATADAAPGEAVTMLSATLDIAVTAKMAEGLTIEAGAPY